MERTFAGILKEAREKTGLSQVELAQKVGLTGSYISILEARRKPPPSDPVIKKLAHALNVDTNRFLTIAHLERTPSDVRERVLKLTKLVQKPRKKGTAVLDFFSSLVTPFTATSPPSVKGMFTRSLTKSISRENPKPHHLLPVLQELPERWPIKLPPRHKHWQEITSDIWRTNRYAFKVEKDAGMTPRIEKGDLLIIDPDLAPGNGDLVMVKQTTEVTVRKYYGVKRGNVQLLALNPDFPPIWINKTQKSMIKGVVVQIIRTLR